MFFKKKEKITKHVNKIDKLVTGLIIGGAVASIIGISKKKKNKKISENIAEEGGKIVKEGEKMVKEGTKIAQKGYSIFGRVLVGILKIFSKGNKDNEK